MFIKLTPNKEGAKESGLTGLYVNADHIVYFWRSSFDNKTNVKIAEYSTWFVEETPEEIMKLLCS